MKALGLHLSELFIPVQCDARETYATDWLPCWSGGWMLIIVNLKLSLPLGHQLGGKEVVWVRQSYLMSVSTARHLQILFLSLNEQNP